jgi:hypothetical protein
VAASIMPNFSHHLTGCPIDEAFSGQRWEPGTRTAALARAGTEDAA